MIRTTTLPSTVYFIRIIIAIVDVITYESFANTFTIIALEVLGWTRSFGSRISAVVFITLIRAVIIIITNKR